MTAVRPELRLRISSDPASLAPVRQMIEAFSAGCGFDESARGQIVLCVNEAMTNITRHAYDGRVDRPVEIEARFADSVLSLSLRDWGKGTVPPGPKQPDPLRPGGVGMVCLLKLMDHVEFVPQPDGMLLNMRRRLR